MCIEVLDSRWAAAKLCIVYKMDRSWMGGGPTKRGTHRSKSTSQCMQTTVLAWPPPDGMWITRRIRVSSSAPSRNSAWPCTLGGPQARKNKGCLFPVCHRRPKNTHPNSLTFAHTLTLAHTHPRPHTRPYPHAHTSPTCPGIHTSTHHFSIAKEGEEMRLLSKSHVQPSGACLKCRRHWVRVHVHAHTNDVCSTVYMCSHTYLCPFSQKSLRTHAYTDAPSLTSHILTHQRHTIAVEPSCEERQVDSLHHEKLSTHFFSLEFSCYLHIRYYSLVWPWHSLTPTTFCLVAIFQVE